jgi:hypothetical protein
MITKIPGVSRQPSPNADILSKHIVFMAKLAIRENIDKHYTIIWGIHDNKLFLV